MALTLALALKRWPGQGPASQPPPPLSCSLYHAPGSTEQFMLLHYCVYTSLFFFFNIYLFIRDTEREREAETQAEGEAGSTQGA